MTDYKRRSHANVTVNRDQDGTLRTLKCRAEYYVEDVDKHENDSDRYLDGVSAKFKFVVSGDVADLTDIKDIEDDPSTGYDSNFGFIQAIPIAEDAVMNVPEIEEVNSTEGHIMQLFDNGRTAVPEASTE